MNIRRIYEPKVEISLWTIGILLTFTALIFPPWKFICNVDAGELHIKLNRPGPFSSVFNIPKVPIDEQSSDGTGSTNGISSECVHPQVDVLRLTLVLFAIAVLCGIPITIIRKRLL